MPKHVSHSFLDPLILPLIPRLYRLLSIPRRFPPEGVILAGHLLAIAGAIGLAFATRTWWAGLLATVGVVGNHIADMVDGTHARTTNQCRNGGELLDHFTDPLSFSYWSIGLAVSVDNLVLALAAVIIIYATAVLTSIRAKLIGQFTLVRFGPTEMKALYALYGAVISGVVASSGTAAAIVVAQVFFGLLLSMGLVQLIVNLVVSVRQVNAEGVPADTTPWILAKGGETSQDKTVLPEPKENNA